MHDDDETTRRRKAALEASPIEVKLLALEYGLSQGQCDGDRTKLAEEAVKLRES
jgi:hypothetical protein